MVGERAPTSVTVKQFTSSSIGSGWKGQSQIFLSVICIFVWILCSIGLTVYSMKVAMNDSWRRVHENLWIKGLLHAKAMRHYRLLCCCGLSLTLSAARETSDIREYKECVQVPASLASRRMEAVSVAFIVAMITCPRRSNLGMEGLLDSARKMPEVTPTLS